MAIIVSHDTDLLPAVEAMARLKGPACVETASWTSSTLSKRLRAQPTVAHNYISEQVFNRVAVRVNYAHIGPG